MMHRPNTTVEGIEWYTKVQSEYERTDTMSSKYSIEYKTEAVKRVVDGGETRGLADAVAMSKVGLAFRHVSSNIAVYGAR